MFGIKQKSIIAMKGLPYTRKTQFAILIASSLKCPALSLDDFLISLLPDYFQSPPSNTSTPPQPQDLAFQIICEVARSHLSTGLFENVVIDSPLASRSHLDQLIELASSLWQTRLLIVECKPKNTYLWQTKFEEYLESHPERIHKWFKAKDWSDIEKEIRYSYDERSDNYKVPKLVLDPFSDYQIYQPIRRIRFFKIPLKPAPFIEAVEYMLSRNEGDGPDLVVYHQWRKSQYRTSPDEKEDIRMQQPFCEAGHNITNYVDGELEYEVDCMACEEQVRGEAYACRDCTLALHKECAESFEKDDAWGNPFPDLKHRFNYNFPKRFACASCKQDEKGFSDYCSSCLFETHLKCRLMPTVIRHDCDEHFLSVVLSPINAFQEVYRCVACGGFARINVYTCKICGVAYHYECLNELPLTLLHEHGGHHHPMLLKRSISKVTEAYFCDECDEKRNPELWFYSCEKCPYLAHLECIYTKMKTVLKPIGLRKSDIFQTHRLL